MDRSRHNRRALTPKTLPDMSITDRPIANVDRFTRLSSCLRDGRFGPSYAIRLDLIGSEIGHPYILIEVFWGVRNVSPV
jgi:hypothetical protein